MSRTIGKVYVDAAITDEQYKECMTLVHEANERMDELQAENAKLRHDLEEANNQAEEVCIENAKLRKLVRDMWRNIPKSESCGWDTDANCCSGSDKCKGECAYWYRMRELGVEVDG